MEIAAYRYTLDDFKREQLRARTLTRATLRELRKNKPSWWKQLLGSAAALAVALPCIVFVTSQSGYNQALALFVIVAPAIGLTTLYHRFWSAYYERSFAGQAEVLVSIDECLHFRCGPVTTSVSRSAITGYRVEPLDLVISLADRLIQIPLRGIRDLAAVEQWLAAGEGK